ncbi:MAG: MFS transporter [Deltaproteobacteria bacterium]|nr:MFS transporter [Deltaproteobacteria bacterium]
MSNSAQAPKRFPALTVPHFRLYAAGSLLSMVGDNIEHVIGYWVIWELTQSPFWLGYAVVAHWLPFTLFSFHSGSLADRFDCRWLIHVSQALYVFTSFGWGFLYLNGELQIWHMAVLLVIHGVAGLIFTPSSMLIIHEMVGADKLVSAVGLNATLRPLSTTIGPAIGGLLMATIGPGWSFIANTLVYVPLSVAMMVFRYRGSSISKRSEGEWTFIRQGLETVRQNATIIGLLGVVAASSFLLGNAFQALLPAFAQRLGASATGYSILLSANGFGAIVGGLLLSSAGARRLRPVVVTVGALTWSVLLIGFSLSSSYWPSLVLLALVGAAQVVFVSMAQSIVQAWAPQAVRGRVIGLYNFAAMGPRALSGFVMGSLATVLGPPNALLLVAGIIGVLILVASMVNRGLWELEMKNEAPPECRGAVAATGS